MRKQKRNECDNQPVSVHLQQPGEQASLNAGPGLCLRTAREKHQLSREDVAAQLRLTKQRIVEIESDHYSSHIPLTFIRGYLRSYARLVNVSANEVIVAFDELGLMEHSDEQKTLPLLKHNRLYENPLCWLMSSIVVLVILLLTISFQMKSSNKTSLVSEDVFEETTGLFDQS